MSYSRRATHAGPNGNGWYESISEKLRKQVEEWMSGAKGGSIHRRLLGIVAPHAGLRFGGPTAGKAYGVAQEYFTSSAGAAVTTVFLLGPSHYKGFEGIEVSDATAYETPLGPIAVDTEAVKVVLDKCKRDGIPAKRTSQKTDEEEHSLELQLPFIAALAARKPVRLVPIIVGIMNPQMEKDFSATLRSYFDDSRNFFIFSSDFCHWGERFRYTYLYETQKREDAIADRIKAMDCRAVELLAAKDVRGWYAYFDKTDNTICGRHPIGIGLHYFSTLPTSTVELLGYSQSNRVTRPTDCSVSYAALSIFA